MAKPKPVSWSIRFWAWLIDIIILGALVFILSVAVHRTYIISMFISFLYWTYFEGKYGYSPGKKAMKLKIVTEKNRKINYTQAALQAFGKSFLLVIDVLIGVILSRKKQRLFSSLAGTVVVKARK
jgi:uncharacterized RDD family membrane protein YckC